ncbi:MAG: GtrA family protein [Clostridia bacterium]|nr:GtrA family protein [Clostridia bacterium]
MKKESVFQVIKFALFSASAGIIQAVSFAIFNEVFGWIYWPSYLTALVLSIVWNFTLNRQYTFKSAVNVPIAMLKLFGFYAVFTPVSTYLGQLASASVNEYIVLAVTMASNLILEFLFCKFVIYKNQENTLEKKSA